MHAFPLEQEQERSAAYIKALLDVLREFAAPSSLAERSEISSLETEQLLRIAERHGVLLPLVSVLQTSAGFQELSRAGQAQQRAKAAQVLQLRALLLELLQAFADAGIEVLCLKGIALAELAYPQAELRECNDLDLLVRSADRQRALQLLEKHNYHPKKKLSAAKQASDFRTQHAIELVRDASAPEVDLHWELYEKQFALPSVNEGIWQRSVRIETSQGPLPTLSREDALLFCCLHGSKELWLRLRTLLDIRLLAGDPKLDWEYFERYLQEEEFHLLLGVPLLMSAQMLGTPLPNRVTKLFSEDATVLNIAATLEQQLIYARTEQPGSDILLQLQLRGTMFQRLRYLAGRLFIPHDSDWDIDLPDALFPLYFILKPIRTIGRGVQAAARTLPSMTGSSSARD